MNRNEKVINIAKLLKKLCGEQQFFKKKPSKDEIATEVSFQISKKITTAGKSFLSAAI